MDISPQSIRAIDFTTVKKGYDPDEVDAFREDVAAALEHAQSQAAQMEARARAAVTRLQEVSKQGAAPPEPVRGRADAEHPQAPVAPSAGDAEVITRTLMLAQRTADATVAEARTEAERIAATARDEAAALVESARSNATTLVDEARNEARRAREDELQKAENDLQALLARREFLLGDVEQLEAYVQAQRERLRDVAGELQDIVERVPGGLGELRRPLLSASAEPVAARAVPAEPDTVPRPVPPSAPEARPEPVLRVVAPPEPETLRLTTLDVDDDDDPMSLFDDRPIGTPPAAPAEFSGDDLLGDDLGAAALFGDEVTAEVPVIRSSATRGGDARPGGDEVQDTRPRARKKFVIGGEELQ